MGYDVIIVGAGSAGCVLAARLSEDSYRSVLLLEAGPDYPDTNALPPEILSGHNAAYTHDWNYFSEPDLNSRIIHLPRAKIVGGCSATNGAFALRGTPEDYNRWSEQGNSGWSFAEVLPFFSRLETDLDFEAVWHGRDGPFPIRRYPQEALTPVQRAFLQACFAAGYSHVEDHNAPGAIGAGTLPMNVVNNERQSAAMVYLAPARVRPNLTIRSGVLVDHIQFQRRSAVGVKLADSAEALWGDHVILAAGTYGSPALLMRSGLGPADHLKALGIRVLENLPGVGQHLSDHPLLELRFTLQQSRVSKNIPCFQTMLTLKSSESVKSQDLHIFPESVVQIASNSTKEVKLILNVSLVRPLSLGWLLLHSSDPSAAPLINLGYFTHPDDMPRMIEAIRVALHLARTSPLSDLLLKEAYPIPWLSSNKNDIEATLRRRVITYSHPVGTCRMGSIKDTMAVVNSRGGVYSVEGLSVVDASIIPEIPAANTNLTTLMVSERCAAWLTEDL